jgi:hypothetical protein
MSVQFDASRSRWVVRWYDAGRQRSRRFQDEQAARAFEADRVRNGFTHERRTPSELHGERGIVYGALDGTDEEFAPAMDASTHYALAPAFYNEVLIRAVEHTRTVIIASSDPAWRRERGIGDDPEESERATRPPDPS